MKKKGIFLWAVILPMLISIGIDCWVGLPDQWNIILYVILSGISSSFWGKSDRRDSPLNVKKFLMICSLLFIFSIGGLFAVDHIEGLMKSDIWEMFCQIGLSLICAISVVIMINVLIIERNKKIKEGHQSYEEK